MTRHSPKDARRFLHMAARLALRGHGLAEPNPLVGCVFVSSGGGIVGWGCHRRFGGPHAEIEALRRAGPAAAGATAYVTLEPCTHHGKTGPCTEALISAKVAKVVIARRDPDPVAAGGLERLRSAGIVVELMDDCEPAAAISDPFVHRVRTGLPWLIAKWAQTLDGAVALRGRENRWISGELSRRLVHRERGRVDAILTGIGTVLADDPLLTARNARRRRIARRVVVDPDLKIPMSAKLVTSIETAPLTVACSTAALELNANKAQALQAAGVELLQYSLRGRHLPLTPLLRELVARHDATNVLVEAGPGLLRRLLAEKLVCEAWVFIAPRLAGDERATHNISGLADDGMIDKSMMRLTKVRRRGDDVLAVYRMVD